MYLKNAGWDLDSAIDAYRDDEQWEKDHPLQAQEHAKKENGRQAAWEGDASWAVIPGPDSVGRGLNTHSTGQHCVESYLMFCGLA